MFQSNNTLENAIDKLKTNGNFRTLITTHNTIDFCSNDYLGFSKSLDLKDRVLKFSRNLDSIAYIGSTGSRTISGNTALIESLESFIATYHNAEAGLLFNSGYDANISLLSSVPKRGDVIYYDEAVHPSIRDGIRLSFAKAYSFKHNDLNSLKNKIKPNFKNAYVVIESVSSRDGDTPPLKEFSNFCQSINTHLIVNESHAVGVFGNGGKGLVVESEITSKVFATVHSFGKALGSQGSIILGSNILRTYLINFARPFMFSTALPFQSYISIKSAYDLLNEDEECLAELHKNIALFRKIITDLPENKILKYIDSTSPIQCFLLEGNENVKKTASILNRNGFDIKPVMSPLVPKGKERIRICIHSFNTKDEINALAQSLSSLSI